MDTNCTYKAPDGKTKCERTCSIEDKCLFHLGAQHPAKLNPGDFYNELCSLIENDDTNWVGFVYPKNFKLYDLTFNTAVDLKWSAFEDIVINNITCNEMFDMRHSIANGSFHISGAKFEKKADFSQSTFRNNVFLIQGILRE